MARTTIHDTSSIDAVLSSAVAAGDVAGVSAAAWSAAGLDYAGAFGNATADRAMRPDTVVWIASMTKAVTATAVMQLVERGSIDLDAPAGDLVPYLANVEVLDGFDTDGSPRFRAPGRPVTTRHLLTHTSGFGYDWTHEQLHRYSPLVPDSPDGSQAGYEQPLMFDPGDDWSYGIGVDWAGRVVEAASGVRLDQYFRQNIFEPLGMRDTTFAASSVPAERRASMRARTPDGLVEVPFVLNDAPEMFMAGGGLYSTVVDYMRFLRMLLGGGSLGGVRVLLDETVAAMGCDQLGIGLSACGWTSYNGGLSNDVVLFPGQRVGWGLSFMINTHRTPEGRSPGSLAWAGLANTYYWLDLAAGVAGVLATQVLPFWDERVLRAFSNFEREVYAATR